MAILIEAPETLRLIDELCRYTGEDPETAVRMAVQERLARLPTPEAEQHSRKRTPEEEAQRRERLQALVDSLAARFEASGQPLVDHGDLLYGEDGLPR